MAMLRRLAPVSIYDKICNSAEFSMFKAELKLS
jgi:hypothetical protein